MDHLRVDIAIGGPIKAADVPGLLRHLAEAGLCDIDTGEPAETFQGADDLLAYADDGPLELCNDDNRGPTLADLEPYLVEQHIAYDRRTYGKFEYDHMVRSYRPGMPAVDRFVTAAGSELVYRGAVVEALAAYQADPAFPGSLAADLEDVLGPDVPELLPLRLV